MTAAWVAGIPLNVSDVDDREQAIRSGPASTAMPAADSSEGRQLRRWLVQLMAAERIIATEAAARHLTGTDGPPLAELADRPGLLELGSVAATLLSQSPLARAVFAAVTGNVPVRADLIDQYYASNLTRFSIPERRTVRHTIDGTDYPLRTLQRGELTGEVERAVFAAAPGEVVGPIEDPLGRHVLRVEAIEPARTRPIDEVRDQIERTLLAGARRRAFVTWLDNRNAELVRLAPGYEHPGDPGQPDNTHRH
jgi:[acyl-carrier-protein] S-malonyltransferase